MQLVIKPICSHCNKEFTAKDIEHNGCIRASVINFEDCPHCKKRNDIWVQVQWPWSEKIGINGQNYDVPEEVAEQFSKFIRKANDSRLKIAELEKQINSAVESVHESESEDIGYNVLCALGQNP